MLARLLAFRGDAILPPKPAVKPGVGQVVFQAFAVNLTPVQIAKANQRRRALMVQIPSGSTQFIGPSATLTTTTGFALPPAGVPFELTRDVWGAAVQAEWFAIGGGMPSTIVVMEECEVPG